MVIDMHSHILPGLDDGSQDMEETKKMLRIAVREGIEGIVTTPHYEVGQGDDWLERYEEAYRKVKSYIQKKNLPIKLYRGNEIFYSEGILEELREGKTHTINGTQYVLVEFSFYESYPYIEKALRTLQNAGYFPIMAHVERYHSLREVEKIQSLVNMGVCIQMNSSAIMGEMGWKIKWFCRKLLKKKLVHVIGTDAHSCRHRRPQISSCLKYLEKRVGKSYRRLVSERNPQKIVKGERVYGKDSD